MKAGQELDALVAEKVMGWHLDESRTNCWAEKVRIEGHALYDKEPYKAWQGGIPEFSTDIAAAWVVVSHMRKTCSVEIKWYGDERIWWCTFSSFSSQEPWWHVEEKTADADGLSSIICVAALKAVGVEVPA